jgi:flagellar motility protein MotE (MotC chaperone)
MLRDLRQRALVLDRREVILAEREAALQSLEADAVVSLDGLDALRTEILELLSREQVATAQRVRTLAKMIDTMKAREAATLLAGMDQDVTILVLRKLKPKQAGKVLAAMPDAVAQRLGDRMTLLTDPRITPDGDGGD